MAVTIAEIKRESWLSARLIGRRYENTPDWDEWWQNDWFAILEKSKPLSVNGDAYIGAVRVVEGKPERWIGMIFPSDTAVPNGFDAAELEPMEFAVCYLCDKQGSSDFYTFETHQLCLKAIGEHGFTRKEDDWCFERYQCPRFTTPDEAGNVILDYAISIEK